VAGKIAVSKEFRSSRPISARPVRSIPALEAYADGNVLQINAPPSTNRCSPSAALNVLAGSCGP